MKFYGGCASDPMKQIVETTSFSGIDRSEGAESHRTGYFCSLPCPDGMSVKEKPPVTKSMLASKNLPQPIVKTSQGHHWIRVLAAELALRLREARETDPALWPKTIVLHARQGKMLFHEACAECNMLLLSSSHFETRI